jgi:hypothetical protein
MHPQLREQFLQDSIDLIRDLIPENEKIIFGALGHPGWGDIGGTKQ